MLHRISRSPEGRAGIYGQIVAVATLDTDEREVLERAVEGATVGDRVAILAGLTRHEDDGEESLRIDPLTSDEGALLAETIETILPALVGDGTWKAQIVHFPVPFAFEEEDEEEGVDEEEADEEEDEVEEDSEDEDEEEGDEVEDQGLEAATDEDGIGEVVLVRLLRVA